jgi:predicted dehydrogenase
LKALVIGYGSIGKRHIENLSKIPKMKIFVLTTRSYDDFLKTKKCFIVKSIKSAISHNPDFAIIANETNIHVKFAKILSKAGIHLFIEKPLSDSIRGINELSQTTYEKKLVTFMGFNFRFHPGIKIIKKLITEKKIGKIISVLVENSSYLPDWHPNENYTKSYSARKELGGGVVLTSIHELDYLYWFFGDVKKIVSITEKISNLKINVEDSASIILKFKNNVTAEIHLDYFQRPSSRYCKLIGTEGTIYWNMNKNEVKIFDIKKKKWLIKKFSKFDYNSMYVEELKHFINCIKNKTHTINNLKSGVSTLKIALAVKHASKYGKMVTLK